MKKVLKIAATAAISMLAANQAFAQAAQQDVNISATVAPFCTIGGSFTPAAAAATVPVSATGVVTTTAIDPFAGSPPTVICNTAADLKAVSVSGGVKNATAPAVGFTNIINYTGAASLGATTSTINTATVGTAAAQEDGNTASTSAAYSGTLAITVTPQTPTLPLIPGGYSDILRVTITPQ